MVLTLCEDSQTFLMGLTGWYTLEALHTVALSRSMRSTHGVLVEHQRALWVESTRGALWPGPPCSWYTMGDTPPVTASRSIRSAHGMGPCCNPSARDHFLPRNGVNTQRDNVLWEAPRPAGQ